MRGSVQTNTNLALLQSVQEGDPFFPYNNLQQHPNLQRHVDVLLMRNKTADPSSRTASLIGDILILILFAGAFGAAVWCSTLMIENVRGDPHDLHIVANCDAAHKKNTFWLGLTPPSATFSPSALHRDGSDTKCFQHDNIPTPVYHFDSPDTMQSNFSSWGNDKTTGGIVGVGLDFTNTSSMTVFTNQNNTGPVASMVAYAALRQHDPTLHQTVGDYVTKVERYVKRDTFPLMTIMTYELFIFISVIQLPLFLGPSYQQAPTAALTVAQDIRSVRGCGVALVCALIAAIVFTDLSALSIFQLLGFISLHMIATRIGRGVNKTRLFLAAIVCVVFTVLGSAVVMLPHGAQVALSITIPYVSWGIGLMQVFASATPNFAEKQPALSAGVCLSLFLAHVVLFLACRKAWNMHQQKKYRRHHHTLQSEDEQPVLHVQGMEMMSNYSSSDTPTPQHQDHVLKIRALSKSFKDTTALNRANITVKKGELLVVLGHNGAGKSTLIDLLSGSDSMMDTTAEEFTMLGHHVPLGGDDKRSKGSIIVDHLKKEGLLATLRQQAKINAPVTHKVRDALEFIASFSRVDDPALAASQIMTKLQLEDENWSTLSGGKAQMVGVAGALVRDADMIVLDEPTSAMDPASRQLLWAVLMEERRRGKTIIVSTHSMEEAEHLADRILVLSHGKEFCCETPQVLRERYGAKYQLTFVKNPEGAMREREGSTHVRTFNEKAVASIFARHGIIDAAQCSNFSPNRESEQDCTYFLALSHQAVFGDLLKAIEEQLTTEIGAVSYGLSMNSLEDAFVEIVNAEQLEDEGQHPEDTTTTSSNSDKALLSTLPDGTSVESLFQLAAFEEPSHRRWLHQLKQQLRISSRSHDLKATNAIVFFTILFIFVPLIIFNFAGVPDPHGAENSTTTTTNNNTTQHVNTSSLPTLVDVETVNIDVRIINESKSCLPQNSDDSKTQLPKESREIVEELIALWRTALTESTGKSPSTFNIIIDTTPQWLVKSFGFDMSPPAPRYDIKTIIDVCTMSHLSTAVPLSHNKIVHLPPPVYSFVLGPEEKTSKLPIENILMLLDLSMKAAIDNYATAAQRKGDEVTTTRKLPPIALQRLPTVGTPTTPAPPEDEEVGFRVLVPNEEGLGDLQGFFMILMYCSILLVMVFMGPWIFAPAKHTTIHGVDERVSTLLKVPYLLLFGALFAIVYVVVVSSLSSTRALSRNHSLVFWNAMSIMSSVPHPFLLVDSFLFILPNRPAWKLAASLLTVMIISVCVVYPILNPVTGVCKLIMWSNPSASAACFFISLLWHALWGVLFVRNTKKPFASPPQSDSVPLNPPTTASTTADDEVANEVSFVEQDENNQCAIAALHVSKQFAKVDNSEKPDPLDAFCASETKTVVDDLTFGVRRGEVFGLLGANGAGKSTTISMLLNETSPDCGTIRYASPQTTSDSLSPDKDPAACFVRSQRWGWCPQADALDPEATAAELLHRFLAYRLGHHYTSKALWEPYVEHVIHKVKLDLKESRDKKVREMSGGMKRRVCVAIALFTGATTVFMDEPSAAVDPFLRRALWATIRDVMAQDPQRAVLLTTHNMEEADAVCSRIGIMRDGGLKCIGNSQQLKSKYSGGYNLTVTLPAIEGYAYSSSEDPGMVSTIAIATDAESFGDELPEEKNNLHPCFRHDATKITNAVKSALGSSCRLTEAMGNQLRFTIDVVPSLAAVFQALERIKNDGHSHHHATNPTNPNTNGSSENTPLQYTVSQVTSLQDIFVAVVGASVLESSDDTLQGPSRVVVGVPVANKTV